MSYISKINNCPRRHVFLSETNYPTGLTNDNSYGTGLVSNQIGVPFDNSALGGDMIWDDTNKCLNIPVKGLYLVSYGYNLRNNNNDTSNSLINVGITYATSSTYDYYDQIISAEDSGSGLRYQISGTFFIFCEANSTIRGYISRSTTQTLVTGMGGTYLSVNLICASRT